MSHQKTGQGGRPGGGDGLHGGVLPQRGAVTEAGAAGGPLCPPPLVGKARCCPDNLTEASSEPLDIQQ